MRGYDSLLEGVQKRYNPSKFQEIENRMYFDLCDVDRKVAKYVKMAMNEVDEKYTQVTIEAGEKVKEHLQRCQYGISYEYQGSVMTKTHIRGNSDIDLLTLTGKFNDTDYTQARNIVESSMYEYSFNQQLRLKDFVGSFSHYQGDANNDLKLLRLENETILKQIYSSCDIEKTKAIRITNLNLNRDVDIVTASWHNSIDYIVSQDKTYRGIQIYDKALNMRLGPDFPFLSINRINVRSSETNGRLKKMIRFLKNVRSDSDKKITLTSFEINAICYNIDINKYKDKYYLDLVGVLWLELYNLCQDEEKANNLKSVDGTEYVFRGKQQKLEDLRLLNNEVFSIYQDLQKK